jgi:hypothetical protein
MAKIKFGMMMTDARGKLGGQVFSKNRGGAFVRTKSTPTNPQTTFQMSVRGIFSAISTKWSTLTEAQRLSYNGFVADYATTDIFGDLRNPSGKNLFQKLNQNLANSEQAQNVVCVAPSAVPFAGLTGAGMDIAGSDISILLNGNTVGSKILLLATPSLTQGTTFVKNKLRVIGVYPGVNASSLDAYPNYVAKYGEPAVGANVYFAVRVVNANGQASPIETIKAVDA